IRCMMHGSEFDLETGEALSGPAYEPLTIYRVDVDGDRVMLVEQESWSALQAELNREGTLDNGKRRIPDLRLRHPCRTEHGRARSLSLHKRSRRTRTTQPLSPWQPLLHRRAQVRPPSRPG